MFWSWIRNAISNNNFVQQFTNHYHNNRNNQENLQTTTITGNVHHTDNRNLNKNLKIDLEKNLNSEFKIVDKNSNNNKNDYTNNNSTPNNNGNQNKIDNNIGYGNKRKQQSDLENNSSSKRLINNQFDGAYLDNLRKLLNMNNDEQTNLLLDRNSNQKSKQQQPNESFYQNWLTEYRNMQLKGKQKLANKVDQVKESLNQLKDNKKIVETTNLLINDDNKLKKFNTPRISLTNENSKDFTEFLDDNKLVKNNLIDFDSQFNQFDQKHRNSKSSDKKLLYQKTDFNDNSSTIKNLPINSELLNTIKVSQAQSYHQQLNISATGNITPVCNFRAQVKRSSYPSGLRTTGLRIGPRLNRDKSRSRLVIF